MKITTKMADMAKEIANATNVQMIINSFRIIKEMIPVEAIDIAVIAKDNPTDNPNPLDDAECYICVDALKDKPMKYFSKPLKDWTLSEEDEKVIDELVKQKLK